MPRHTHYGKDPIIEAILGVSISAKHPLSLDEMKSRGRAAYPQYEKVTPLPKNFYPPIKDDQELVVSEAHGYAFADGNKSVHVRADEFSFHKRAPYGSWEDFFPEAYEAWLKYRAFTKIDKVSKLYVRYVNKIPIPIRKGKPIHMELYLNNVPKHPNMKGWRFVHFFNQVMVRYGAKKANMKHAIVTQAILGITDKELSLVVDIDVHQHVSLTAKSDLRKSLLSFRQIKNEVFNKIITPTTKKLLR